MSFQAYPLVAIVGQPNVGKSTLLNKIAGPKLAVTSTLAGTTRDRQYAETLWRGVNFTLVDTAGLNLQIRDELEKNIQKQIDVALEEAELIILVVDGKQPAAALENTTLKKFRNTKKPILLAVNKLDSPKTAEAKLLEFTKLGIKKMFAISALTGKGLGEMLDEITTILDFSSAKPGGQEVLKKPGALPVAIVGKPNVGKSSIFNKILKDERTVVSPLPGTTRTAIDEELMIKGVNYTFIDTAGLKKKEYRQQQADVFAGFQTFKSIRRSDVSFFVLDMTQEITKQDQRVAKEILDMHKGCIIVANKIDLYTGDRDKMLDYVSAHFPFLWMCPVFFVSAVTGEGLLEAIDAIKPIYDRRNKKINNQTLSEFLSKMLKKNPPRLLRDQKKPKVFSLHQVDVNPPTFLLLVNHPAAISTQFRKFMGNSIIRELDFWGTPLILKLIGKDKA